MLSFSYLSVLVFRPSWTRCCCLLDTGRCQQNSVESSTVRDDFIDDGELADDEFLCDRRIRHDSRATEKCGKVCPDLMNHDGL